ncbi:MAG: arginine--tRNA ligase [Clostridia bacterium]|nr:arginine--tRNA ligase [Clostridia bacterium]
MNFKQIISDKISKVTQIDEKELETYIEIPKDAKNGDYSFPCFRLAKELKKAPPVIANEIKEVIEKEIEQIKEIEKVEVIGGYLNFFINKEILVEEVLKEVSKTQEYGKSEVGKGKNIVIDYSAPNIAKPFHIGHLRTTLIGNSLYRTYKYLGYNTTGINHLGDYGTQFGKMIEAYKMWKDEYNLEEDPINKMMDMYVRINSLCKEDEQVLERCRENFRLLESGDKYCVDLWNRFKDLSMVEFNKIYDILNVKFDSYNGEAFYADKTDEVIKTLEEKEKLTESEGARIVDLEDVGINTPCLIQKANGSSIYATRDLAAIMYRAKTYDFDKCLYVVAYEQNLHFKQIFEVAKYLVDEKYAKGLEHVSYGMVSLPTGKMSTRLGNVVKIEDLINGTIEKAQEIIAEKNPNLENKDEVAKKVGIGAIVFNTLSTVTTKDQIFDWNTALNFQGETGPYIQYTYVRTRSVLEKAGYVPKSEDIKIENLTDEYSLEILKLMYNFEDVLIQVTDKNEPSILSRYLIDLAKAYSSFYNENKIIVEDKEIQDARIYLTYAVGNVLKQGAQLLGIEMPEKM